MKLQTLSRWLKAVIIGVAIIAAVVFFIAVPSYGQTTVSFYPEFSNRYWPWLLFLEISSLPFWAALVLGWRIVGNIGRGEAFSSANARMLGWISRLAAVDSAYFFLGNVGLMLASMSHPGVALASLAVVLVGVGVTVGAAILSHLVGKAAAMRELTDLTI